MPRAEIESEFADAPTLLSGNGERNRAIRVTAISGGGPPLTEYFP
jgi:hypothetical protein